MRSPSTRTGAAAAAPAAAAPAAAAVAGAAGQGAGDWQGVPAGTCTAGTVASPSSAGCTTRAPASEPRVGRRGRPGAAQWGCPPPSALCPPQWLCPCSDPLWAGAGAGASHVLPTEPHWCQGASAALRVLSAAAPAPSEGACPAMGSPSWQRPLCHALGSSRTSKGPGSAKGGHILIPTPTGTGQLLLHPLPRVSCSWCCRVGSAAACLLPRVPGSALVPLQLHDGAMHSPQPCPTRCPLLLPSILASSILASSILQHCPLASAPCLTQCHPQLDPEGSPSPKPHAQGRGVQCWAGSCPCAMCPGLMHDPA